MTDRAKKRRVPAPERALEQGGFAETAEERLDLHKSGSFRGEGGSDLQIMHLPSSGIQTL